jgi:hypothetical protein
LEPPNYLNQIIAATANIVESRGLLIDRGLIGIDRGVSFPPEDMVANNCSCAPDLALESSRRA